MYGVSIYANSNPDRLEFDHTYGLLTAGHTFLLRDKVSGIKSRR